MMTNGKSFELVVANGLQDGAALVISKFPIVISARPGADVVLIDCDPDLVITIDQEGDQLTVHRSDGLQTKEFLQDLETVNLGSCDIFIKASGAVVELMLEQESIQTQDVNASALQSDLLRDLTKKGLVPTRVRWTAAACAAIASVVLGFTWLSANANSEAVIRANLDSAIRQYGAQRVQVVEVNGNFEVSAEFETEASKVSFERWSQSRSDGHIKLVKSSVKKPIEPLDSSVKGAPVDLGPACPKACFDPSKIAMVSIDSTSRVYLKDGKTIIAGDLLAPGVRVVSIAADHLIATKGEERVFVGFGDEDIAQ